MTARCCLCPEVFAGIGYLEVHIATDHYNCLPYECEKCKFAKFPTAFSLKQHYRDIHRQDVYVIRQQNTPEITEKKQKIRECLERCIRQGDISSSQHQLGMGSQCIITGEIENPTSPCLPSRLQVLPEKEHPTLPAKDCHPEFIEQQQEQSCSATGHRQQAIGTRNVDKASNAATNLLEQFKQEVMPLSEFDPPTQAPSNSNPNPVVRGTQTAKSAKASEGTKGLLPSKAAKSCKKATNAHTRPKELQCQVCKLFVVNRFSSLIYHVNVMHMKLPMRKCRCGEGFMWNKRKADNHAKHTGHSESENLWSVHYPLVRARIGDFFILTGPEAPQQLGGGQQQQPMTAMPPKAVEARAVEMTRLAAPRKGASSAQGTSSSVHQQPAETYGQLYGQSARLVASFMKFVGEKQQIGQNAVELIPVFLGRRSELTIDLQKEIAPYLTDLATTIERAKGMK